MWSCQGRGDGYGEGTRSFPFPTTRIDDGRLGLLAVPRRSSMTLARLGVVVGWCGSVGRISTVAWGRREAVLAVSGRGDAGDVERLVLSQGHDSLAWDVMVGMDARILRHPRSRQARVHVCCPSLSRLAAFKRKRVSIGRHGGSCGGILMENTRTRLGTYQGCVL